jgi:hypothetical protein
MGAEGLYAIVQKAKSMGICPLDALNGGMFCVNGKVEMSAQMMNRLIRSKGHSIQKIDEKCTKTCCVLKGKRADNGDVWMISFSVEDAKRAGLVKLNGPWEKFPEAMCFARALSMLARQLFPDVIVDTYVEGEISDAPGLFEPVKATISEEQLVELLGIISKTSAPKDLESKIYQIFNIQDLRSIPLNRFDGLVAWIKKTFAIQEIKSVELNPAEVQNLAEKV